MIKFFLIFNLQSFTIIIISHSLQPSVKFTHLAAWWGKFIVWILIYVVGKWRWWYAFSLVGSFYGYLECFGEILNFLRDFGVNFNEYCNFGVDFEVIFRILETNSWDYNLKMANDNPQLYWNKQQKISLSPPPTPALLLQKIIKWCVNKLLNLPWQMTHIVSENDKTHIKLSSHCEHMIQSLQIAAAFFRE